MKATKWVHDWHDGSRPREEILQMNNRANHERQFNRACQRRDSSQTISTKEEAKPPKSYGDVPGCHWYVLKCTNIEIADVNAILEILTTFPLQNNKILLLLPTSFWELVWGVIKTHTQLILRLAEVQVIANTPVKNVRTKLNRRTEVEDISTSFCFHLSSWFTLES